MRTSTISGLHALRRALLTIALVGGSAASAQDSTPQTIPGLDGFNLPATRPTPQPTPAPAPTTRPVPQPTPPAAEPTPRATVTPKPRASARPTPRAPPTPSPRVVAAPALVIASPSETTVAPTPLSVAPAQSGPVSQPSPLVTPDPVAPSRSGPWGWAGLGGGVLMLAVILFALWRRRHLPPAREKDRRDAHRAVVPETADTPVVLPPPPEPVPSAVPSMPASAPVTLSPEPAPVASGAPRAMLEVALVPKRAGTNLLSASVEYHVTLHNAGTVPATGVRLDIRLLSVGPSQDGILAALFASPIAKSIIAAVQIPAGTTLDLDGMAMHPKETLELLGTGEPALFVPVVSVNIRYDWDGGVGQTARAFVVGMVRGAGAKLQPFRRDGLARMFDTVGSIEYAVGVVN